MNKDDEEAFENLQKMIIPILQNRDSKSPPKAQVDEASLQQAMDKNKESLKVKLMMRRPRNQLIEQGIMPSLNVPPHFHEQRQKLERAKMGDFLKNKIQRRPDRQELIQQHILEDTTVDPSLQDKQRQLKKARLADDLNDRLSHRPGPLELVKGNILHADEKFAQAVKEGQIPFKRTCEGQSLRHPLPSFKVEDDSGSDVALSPPQDLLDQSLNSISSSEALVLSPYPNHDSPSNSLGELRITPPTPPSSLPSPVSSQFNNISQNEISHRENVTPIRIRKKSKPKAQPKTRTIKFHEYKGPPSAQKNQASTSPSETSYELLLKQQQLFLQWQLEWQQKYPQMILPKPAGDQTKASNGAQNTVEQSHDVPLSPQQNFLSKFEDMKVSDLKIELKRRNLPVSGSKPQLIERLKLHLETNNINKLVSEANKVNTETTALPLNVGGIILDTLPTLVSQSEPVTSILAVEAPVTQTSTQLEDAGVMVYNAVPVQGQIVTSRPSSTAPMDIEINSNCDAMDCSDNTNAINENIVKLQQKKIQQLQRELQRSQMQLQQQQWLQQQAQQAQQQALLVSQTVPIAPVLPSHQAPATSLSTSLSQTNVVDTKALQKLQQHLQQKFQQQLLLQQLQAGNTGKLASGSPAISAAVKANLAAFIHNQHSNPHIRITNGITTVNQQSLPSFSGLKPIVVCQARTIPGLVDKPRANSLPNGVGQQKLIFTTSLPNFSNIVSAKSIPAQETETTETKLLAKKNASDYNEITKQLPKTHQDKAHSSKRSGKKSVKSQAVDDVLEILIKNGELPPSAAQEPPTPTTPETQKSTSSGRPAFPNNVNTKLAESSNISQNFTNPQADLPAISAPSTVLNESDTNSDPPLVFDLHLGLQDIEAMDLGVLDRNDTSQSCIDTMQQQTNESCPTSNGDVDMDFELSDWLDVLTNNNPSSNTNEQREYSYSDPLLSSMENNQDTLDMFSIDEIDFKTSSDMNILNWDKVDFAT